MNIAAFIEENKQTNVKIVNTIDITPFIKYLESYFNKTIIVNKFKLEELGNIVATTNYPNIIITASVFEEQDDFAFMFTVMLAAPGTKIFIQGIYKNHQWNFSIDQCDVNYIFEGLRYDCNKR